MAEEKKKKMSVAEILAAARKADGKGGSPEPPTSDAPDGDGATSPGEQPGQAVSASSEPAKEAPAKPAAKPGGGKPSTADILAMARAGAKAKAEAPVKAAPAAEKPKPAPKAAEPKAAPPKKAAAAPSEPKDTASILAAARKENRPGPISKEEAAKQGKPVAPAKAPAARKAVVPPMPPRPDFAKLRAEREAAKEDRRGFMSLILGSTLGLGFTSLTVTSGLWTLAFARFMFPNVLIEPPSRFKVGFPSDFPPGEVSDRFKAQFGLWVINGEYNGQRQIYALRTVCTHLGCTPNWLESEQKFKCPCHGSGFYKDGINFEGPAPRPLERYAIRISDDGQLEVDKSKIFQEEMGQWEEAASYVTV